MRFFRTEVATRDKGLSPFRISELGDLYEQVGRRAVVMPTADRRHPSWHLDEDGRRTFIVYVFAMDASATEASVEQIVRDACDEWGVGDVDDVAVEQATFSDDFAGCEGWHHLSSRSVLQKGNLFELYDFTRSKRVFKDWLVLRKDAEACRAAAGGCAYSDDLGAEVGRILAGGGRGGAGETGVPVHYLLEGCERSDHEAALETLLEALLAAGRLPSGHALEFNFDNARVNRVHLFGEEGTRDAINESLAFALAGNVVVVQYGREDRDGRYDEVAYGDFCRFMDVMRPHLGSTLAVLCVPSGNEDLKRRVRKMAGVPLVEIAPDAAPDARGMARDEALGKLGEIAAASGAEPDGRLGEMLDEALADAGFRDLGELFEDWRREKLVSGRFPEYGAELTKALELRGESGSDAMASLDELIGLGPVKRQLRDILARFRMNREAERLGLPARPFSMHLAFLGRPGTGKSEVARLYGQALKEAGALPEGRVVVVSGSEVNRCDVCALFERARGSVLFVDEAYSMALPGQIAEFIACMENNRDDTVVILAGYEQRMDALLDSNPGFRSRLGFTLRFPDYSEDEMLAIFDLMCRRAGLVLSEGARREARDLLARSGRRADQGNARFVRKLFEDAVGAQQVRLARAHDGGAELTAEAMSALEERDVVEAGRARCPDAEPSASARNELDALVGLGDVKRLVSERIDFLRVQKARRDAGFSAGAVPAHMAFTGPPGVGKTEVARLMGRILREEGVLSVGDFYECTGASLNVPMAGASEAKVRALFQKARGSVVFIDEAYSMLQHARGADNEAIAALIAEMERYRDEVVVILAGYEREVGELLKSNPGFSSRVRTKVEFPGYSADELADIFALMLERRGLVAGEGAAEKARGILERASGLEGFGNARFVRNMVEDALLKQGSRLARELDGAGGAPDAERLRAIEACDIEWEPVEAARRPIGFAA